MVVRTRVTGGAEFVDTLWQIADKHLRTKGLDGEVDTLHGIDGVKSTGQFITILNT